MTDPFEHPLLPQWLGVISRCYNPKAHSYEHYGGRGIRVCRRWHRFEAFAKDMGPRPSPKHSIDRLNVDGDYKPSNCAWATPTQQNRNTRRTRRFTIDGITRSRSEWAEHAGISPHTLCSRLRRGWPTALALSTPTDRPAGEGRVVARQFSKLAKVHGIAPSTFYWRMSKGWSEHEALTTPCGHKRPTLELCKVAGVPLTTFYDRCKRGWSEHDALHTPTRQKPQF